MFHVRRSCRLGLVMVILMLGGITLASCVRRVVSVDQVEKMIKDQVPVGSGKQRVKAFIDNLKVDSLRIERADFHEATTQNLGNRDPEKIAELGNRIAEFGGAVIFDAHSGLIYHAHIVIQFYIDKAGWMIGYTVKIVEAV